MSEKYGGQSWLFGQASIGEGTNLSKFFCAVFLVMTMAIGASPAEAHDPAVFTACATSRADGRYCESSIAVTAGKTVRFFGRISGHGGQLVVWAGNTDANTRVIARPWIRTDGTFRFTWQARAVHAQGPTYRFYICKQPGIRHGCTVVSVSVHLDAN